MVGTAQDMIAAGLELPTILQAGRWKSPAMVNRHGERLPAHKGAAARLALLQQRGARRCRHRLGDTTVILRS